MLLEALKKEVHRRLIEESMERVKFCLMQLSEAEIWYRPNENSNSVGNLVLHLCGNAKQWIVAGLTDIKDTRQRDEEFDEKGPLPTAQLLRLLDDTRLAIEQTLNQLREEDLLKTFQVQGFQESGLAILIHVVEHFSYHTGQITYFLKARKNRDTGYYAGQDLNQK